MWPKKSLDKDYSMGNSNIKKNYILNTIFQIFNLLVPLVTTPYLSRVLGADGIGTNSFVSANAGYFCLIAALGIQTYGQREISCNQNNKEKRTKVFWEIVILGFISTIFSLVCYFVFAFFHKDRELFYLYGIQVLTVMFDITWLYTGMENFSIPVKRNFIIKILSIICIFIFVRSKDDLWKYILICLLWNLLGNLLMWISIRKFVYLKISLGGSLKHLKPIIGLFVPTIAIQIYTNMDKVMIGYLSDDLSHNGYYEQSMKLIRLLLTLVVSLSTVMIPKISNYFSENKIEEMKELIYKAFNFVLFLSIPCCLGISITIRDIIPWFFGEGYDAVALLTIILAPQIIFVGLNNITAYQCLIPRKLERVFTVTVSLGALLNFLGNIILIPQYGAVGAALSSTATELIVLVSELIYLKKDINILAILRMCINYIISGSIMAIVVVVINKFLPSTFMGVLCTIAIGVGIYFICLLILKDGFLYGPVFTQIKKIKKVFLKEPTRH